MSEERSPSRRHEHHHSGSHHRHDDYDYDEYRAYDERSSHHHSRSRSRRHSHSHHHRDDFANDDNDDDGEQALFVGNLDDDVTQDELARAFEREGGRVSSVDIKQGYAFVYMLRGARRTCERLDGATLGRRRVHVEVARNPQPSTRGTDRRVLRDPCETLFIANCDVASEAELSDMCARYGEIVRVSMRRNFCFVEFRRLDDAVAAQRALAGSLYGNRRITVDFAQQSSSHSATRTTATTSARSPSPPPSRQRGSPTYSPYHN